MTPSTTPPVTLSDTVTPPVILSDTVTPPVILSDTVMPGAKDLSALSAQPPSSSRLRRRWAIESLPASPSRLRRRWTIRSFVAGWTAASQDDGRRETRRRP